MITFSVSSKDGQQVVGIGLSDEDIANLRAGEPLICDLGSTGTGFWSSGSKGRIFLQPRDSHVFLMHGDTAEDIGRALKVKMPDLDEVKRDLAK